MSVVEALAREVGSVGKAMHKFDGKTWTLPTRCPPMTVKDIVAHMARGGERILEMIAKGPVDAEPEKDAVTYFQSFSGADDAAGVVQRAQQVAAEYTPAELVRYWDESWGKALRAARVEVSEDPVLPSVFGLMRLSEYLKTRIVEVVIHHMDVDEAIGHDPHPDAEALEIAADVLRGMLGTDLRRAGMDDVRFLLTGTGRATLNDKEVAYLGPLATKFPLFS